MLGTIHYASRGTECHGHRDCPFNLRKGYFMKPLLDRVVVKPIENKDTTDGGLYIPEPAQEKPQIGKILAVGEGRTENGVKIDMTLKVGDKVLFTKYGGQEVKYEGDDVLIMREVDVLAVL